MSSYSYDTDTTTSRSGRSGMPILALIYGTAAIIALAASAFFIALAMQDKLNPIKMGVGGGLLFVALFLFGIAQLIYHIAQTAHNTRHTGHNTECLEEIAATLKRIEKNLPPAEKKD